MENDKIIRLALKTVEEMFEDRGYAAIENEGYPETDVVVRLKNTIFFTPNCKLARIEVVDSVGQVKSFSNYIDSEDYETIFFVFLGNVTVAHKSIEKNLNYKIEIWPVTGLLSNIARNELQPQIQKMENLKLNFKPPKITQNDPLARYYRLRAGDVIKVTHKNGFISYRIVM